MTWRYALTSIAGTSHIAAGKACDDSCHCEVIKAPLGDDYFVAIVSDGAGSSELSRYGSQVVVVAIADNVRSWLSDGGNLGSLGRETVLDWLDNVRDRIAQLAKNESTCPKDYAATLVFAIVGPDAAAFGQLGDGAVVIADGPANWSAVFWPQHGDYANQTYFVTDDAAAETIAFKVLEGPVGELVLFTDGLERVLLDFALQKAHPPVFSRMVAPLRNAQGPGEIATLSAQLTAYLKSPGISAHSDDDLTLVIATCREATATTVSV